MLIPGWGVKNSITNPMINNASDIKKPSLYLHGGSNNLFFTGLFTHIKVFGDLKI